MKLDCSHEELKTLLEVISSPPQVLGSPSLSDSIPEVLKRDLSDEEKELVRNQIESSGRPYQQTLGGLISPLEVKKIDADCENRDITGGDVVVGIPDDPTTWPCVYTSTTDTAGICIPTAGYRWFLISRPAEGSA